MRIQQREHKRIRGPEYREKHRLNSLVRSRNYAAFLSEFKRGKPCVDCKQIFDPCVMDFDHRDPSTKRNCVGVMSTWSRKTIMDEIQKCDLVCSNCHRMRTKKMRDQTRGEFFIGFKKADDKQLKFL